MLINRLKNSQGARTHHGIWFSLSLVLPTSLKTWHDMEKYNYTLCIHILIRNNTYVYIIDSYWYSWITAFKPTNPNQKPFQTNVQHYTWPWSCSAVSSCDSKIPGTDRKPCAATALPGFAKALRISCSISWWPGGRGASTLRIVKDDSNCWNGWVFPDEWLIWIDLVEFLGVCSEDISSRFFPR